MCQLYVTNGKALVRLHGNRIEVMEDGCVKSEIPIETMESINVFGTAQLTTPLINECLKRKLPVQFHSFGGRYLGLLTAVNTNNSGRIRLQVHSSEDEKFYMLLAKTVIAAKIHNQVVLLLRYARKRSIDIEEQISEMKRIERHIFSCKTVAEIMGCEGYAAIVYFKVLSLLTIEEFHFEGRSKHSPKDPFNLLLSLGYTVLHKELICALERHGLNAAVGIFHSDRIGHAALASDLMEEWRSVIVDAVVLGLVNGNEIKETDFYVEKESVQITKYGLTIFYNKLEEKLKTRTGYLSYIEESVDYRRAIDLQICHLIKAMEQEQPLLYKPVRKH